MFADEIKDTISEEAYNLLTHTGVGSYDEMFALLVQFPTIGNISGISLPSLSNVAAASVSPAARSRAQTHRQNYLRFGRGAFSPPKSIVGNGYQQPAASTASTTTGPTTSGSISYTLGGSVRDQGQRGTCVAHGAVACIEWSSSFQPLSEQFKYWATKTRGDDPFPDEEGTWLRCAKNSLASVGVCEAPLWPYNPQLIPGNETHAGPGSPSPAALHDALQRTQSVATYNDTSRQNSGKASLLAQELQHGPVAISVPVFIDVVTNMENWSWTGAYDYGHVIDPTPLSVVDGGHAVCVCGYFPSSAAPGGGWFLFKNSWGVNNWSNGSNTPPSGHPPWTAGYGYLSAAYVDEYLWELLRV